MSRIRTLRVRQMGWDFRGEVHISDNRLATKARFQRNAPWLRSRIPGNRGLLISRNQPIAGESHADDAQTKQGFNGSIDQCESKDPSGKQ